MNIFACFLKNTIFTLSVPSMVCIAGLTAFSAWILTKAMRRNAVKASLKVNLAISMTLSVMLCLRYDTISTVLQGISLCFVLLYGSCCDLTDHTVPDFIWIMTAILGLCSVTEMGIFSMLLGAVMVFIPQFMVAVFAKRAIGGADIKLSTALAFLLGWQRGLAALILGMLFAVIIVGIRQKCNKELKKQPFALVPFLSAAAMVVFLM